MTLRVLSPQPLSELRPDSAKRLIISKRFALRTQWNWMFWRLVNRIEAPPSGSMQYFSASSSTRLYCSRVKGPPPGIEIRIK